MPKQTILFENFTAAAGSEHAKFINDLHDLLTEHGCLITIKEAKSGYVASYIYSATKQTVVNYVFRKKGPMLRIYANNIQYYMDVLDKWPDAMKNMIHKAGPCKRLFDPTACNPRCLMGFDFILDGARQLKCRNNAFMFFLADDTKPYLWEMAEQEILARKNYL